MASELRQQKFNFTLMSVVKFGSNWNNGTNAGTFYWNLNNSAGNANSNISSRLLCVSLS